MSGTQDRDDGVTPLFEAALRGEPCLVHGIGTRPLRMPTWRWSGPTDRSDAEMLAHCDGPTLDIGCGPGRMSSHLAASGVGVLGIDIAPEAVAQTRRRGATALHRDVFDGLPGEGGWLCALPADGNIGIGGDPVTLLRRVVDVLARGGWVVADVQPPGRRLGLLASLVVVVGVLGVLRLPPLVRRPAIVGLGVLLSVTLMAVPVLGRFWAKPDDPSLLNRPYPALWLLFAGLVTVGVALAAFRTAVRTRRSHGDGADGRRRRNRA